MPRMQARTRINGLRPHQRPNLVGVLNTEVGVRQQPVNALQAVVRVRHRLAPLGARGVSGIFKGVPRIAIQELVTTAHITKLFF